MNTLIALLILYHSATLVGRKEPLSLTSRGLLYLGAILPIGDQGLRVFRGEYWFYSGRFAFSSLILEGTFWCALTLLYYIGSRSWEKSRSLLLPLVGLITILGVTYASGGRINPLAPWSAKSFQLEYYQTGYWFPIIILIGLLVLKRIFRWPKIVVSACSLGFLLFFAISTGISIKTIHKALPASLRDTEQLRVFPANLPQTEWYVVGITKTSYRFQLYHLFGGWREEPITQRIVNDRDLTQKSLTDPIAKTIFLNSFFNPVLQATVRGETLQILVTELLPQASRWRVERVEITKNRSEQILNTTTHYHLFGWSFSI